ncbi:MAG: hypothetical protein A2Z98_14925 [Spirochaetes bacterium GWB1_27_13]|nr:MAG: hypothetical protein A2Z98_14925 [Spirochaetes bacterium GWB1_27_13]
MTSEQISGYDKKIKKDCIQYSLKWSPYILGEKFNVLKKLTEMTGLYVVFSLNKYKRLIPVILGASWYTGLRPTVLKIFTPTSVDVIPLSVTQKLEDQKLYIKRLLLTQMVLKHQQA